MGALQHSTLVPSTVSPARCTNRYRRAGGDYGRRSGYYFLTGIPTQVVVPSVSLAALLHGLAGTVLVEMPSSAGLDSPVVELGACSAIPRTSAGGIGVCARPEAGGEGMAPPDVGGPPPTRPAGGPPPTAPAGEPPPTAGASEPADVPMPPCPPGPPPAP
jgi:hypothetical protein